MGYFEAGNKAGGRQWFPTILLFNLWGKKSKEHFLLFLSKDQA